MLARIIEKSINNILTTLSISIFSIVPTHVETVCLLGNTQSKKKESYITLDVEMADYYRIKNEGKNSST